MASERKRTRENSSSPLGSSASHLPSNALFSESPRRLTSLTASSPGPYAHDPIEEDVENDDEAVEDDEFADESMGLDFEEDEDEKNGIDLFGSEMDRDYAPNQDLDRYDVRAIDDREYESLDYDQRRAVEAKLRRRDVLEGRLPAVFLDGEDEFGEQDEIQMQRRRRRYRRHEYEHGGADGDSEMDADDEAGAPDLLLESLHDLKGRSVPEWLAMERARHSVKGEFRNFLLGYVDEKGNSVYGQRIRKMGETSGESLEVSFRHLEDANAILAYLLSNAPNEMLSIFDEVAFEAVEIIFEAYSRIRQVIHVRITDLPVVLSIRELREQHLNSLVRVSGVVTRRTGVFPQLKLVKYDCVKCGYVIGPIAQDATSEVKVRACPNCMSKGPFNLNSEQTVYRNFQRLTLQETPGTVPAGRLPRHRDVVLLWDLVDSARPGDEIEVTGVFRHNFDNRLNTRMGFPVFSTVIEANHISKRGDEFASLRLTQDDISQIRALSRDSMIARRIIKSMAPSIYGHEDIKTALALALFGGVPKNVNNKHRVRGDINVLLLGDPGTAKSQFLKYVEKTCHRAVFTTGQGASAVGLTAAVRKDPVSREWTLEGGALVLADKGVCMIDEFDKMNDSDRTSIHEAMEQQTISISKAGIVTTLHARCAIIAAANPLRGRYNPQLTFSQNVDLTEPILSRFDILCVVRDRADPVQDEMLAEFVLNSHVRSHPLTPKTTASKNVTINATKKINNDNTDEAATKTGNTNTNANDNANYNADGDAEKNGNGNVGSRQSQVAAVATESLLDAGIIPQDILKKYIMYAKENVEPRVQEIDEDKLSRLYAELRRESLQTGSIPITVRHLESVIRMAEAHARMHLRAVVRADDIDMGIGVALDSFIGAQKYTVMRQLRRAFSKYVRTHTDNEALLLHTVNGLVRDAVRMYQLSHHSGLPPMVSIPLEELASRAREMGIHNIEPFLECQAFRAHGFRVEQQQRAASSAAAGAASSGLRRRVIVKMM